MRRRPPSMENVRWSGGRDAAVSSASTRYYASSRLFGGFGGAGPRFPKTGRFAPLSSFIKVPAEVDRRSHAPDLTPTEEARQNQRGPTRAVRQSVCAQETPPCRPAPKPAPKPPADCYRAPCPAAQANAIIKKRPGSPPAAAPQPKKNSPPPVWAKL